MQTVLKQIQEETTAWGPGDDVACRTQPSQLLDSGR